MRLNHFLKRLASKFPVSLQNELKRILFLHQVRRGTFSTDEKEYELLEQWVGEGDWVIDVGANIGHYSAKLSDLVGGSGRIIAFEPVPATFELLAATVSRMRNKNVTLLNLAASDASNLVGMAIPKFPSGLDNNYMAHLANNTESALRVLTVPIDNLEIPRRVSLVKIDAEGHDLQVINGMQRLVERDRPVIITESNDDSIRKILSAAGYRERRFKGSSNVIYEATTNSIG